ncbi:hypothetical protein HMPREF3201_01157 [Megasphaera sp. MJR8396C]|nr:hypothetical protein HMPREF3201_01157 [Megasphaera sp. MJR8396C]
MSINNKDAESIKLNNLILNLFYHKKRKKSQKLINFNLILIDKCLPFNIFL